MTDIAAQIRNQQQQPDTSMTDHSKKGPEGEGTDADQNYQFYKEYCRLYYANIILTNRLQQLLNEKKDLQFKLNRLEVRRETKETLYGHNLPPI